MKSDSYIFSFLSKHSFGRTLRRALGPHAEGVRQERRVQKGLVMRDAGGAGMVLSNTAADGKEIIADENLLLTVGVGETKLRKAQR